MGLNLNEIASGSKAFPFEEIGDKVTGTILLVERRQQRSFDGGKPLEWDDGSPRMLTYVELQTDLRDDENDDGIRALYCKGGNFEIAEGRGEAAEKALVNAAREAKADSIEEGGTLTAVFSGRSKATVRGYQPAKLFVMRYEPPVSKIDVSDDELFG
jgi:hypothetical protein